MAKNWDHAAGLIWQPLVTAAQKRQLLFYEDLAPVIPTNPLNVGRALGPIQAFCWDTHLPPLTAIVVNKHSGLPGDGFFAWDLDNLREGQEEVFDKDWSTIPNPFGSFGPSDSIESLGHDLVRSPDNSETIYRKVPDRGVAQRVFRAALMEAYDGQCAMCRLSFPAALEAAHIIPWSKATRKQRLDVRNGLLLCSNHHRLFDDQSLTITPNFKISFYDLNMEDGPYSEADKATSIDLHDKEILLPNDKRLWPDVSSLSRKKENAA